MRKAAIQAALDDYRLSRSQAQRLMEEMGQKNGQGHFREFCFVIKQACEKYLKRFDKPQGKK